MAGQPVKKGQVMARIDPLDASQQVAADRAESARLEALLAQRERLVARQRELVERNFISAHALDDVTAQRDALRSQFCRRPGPEMKYHGMGLDAPKSSPPSMAMSKSRSSALETTSRSVIPFFALISTLG